MSNSKADYARQILRDFVPVIDTELEKYWDKELSELDIVSPKVLDTANEMLMHSKEHNLRRAKRLRAAFVYYTFKLFDKKVNEQDLLHAAMSIELVHTALLMHDDFMDQDDTRRGKPTTHEHFREYHRTKLSHGPSKHFGNALAVDVGDTVLTMGYRCLAEVNFDPKRRNEALIHMLDGIIQTGYGQAFDMIMESTSRADEEDVIALHLAKTSVYTYKTPTLIGAILAGASKRDQELIERYAIPGGIAFQIQDDIIGLFGDTEKTGKPVHSDLREGKKTLLILKALEFGDKKQTRRIMEVWGNKHIKDSDAQDVRDIIIETGSLQYSYDLATKFARESQKVIPEMVKRHWNQKSIDFLDGISEHMAVDREW